MLDPLKLLNGFKQNQPWKNIRFYLVRTGELSAYRTPCCSRITLGKPGLSCGFHREPATTSVLARHTPVLLDELIHLQNQPILLLKLKSLQQWSNVPQNEHQSFISIVLNYLSLFSKARETRKYWSFWIVQKNSRFGIYFKFKTWKSKNLVSVNLTVRIMISARI